MRGPNAAQVKRDVLAHLERMDRILAQRKRILAIRDGPLLTPSELLDKLEAKAREEHMTHELERWRDALKDALREADEALGGDSNDAEHDALYGIRETIAGLLGVTTGPPEPADASEEYGQ